MGYSWKEFKGDINPKNWGWVKSTVDYFDPSKSAKIAAESSEKTGKAAAELAEKQYQRQLTGLQQSMGQWGRLQNLYNQVYGMPADQKMAGPTNPLAGNATTAKLNAMMKGGG